MTERAADLHLAETFVTLAFRPRRTLTELTKQSSARPGASAVALLATFWTLFLIVLWNAGQVPRAVWLPIPADWYYLVEALAMLPVLTGLWWLHSEIAHRLAVRFGGKGAEAGVRTALGFAYAVPMVVAILGELGVYLIFGFETLSLAARFLMPTAALLVWFLSAWAIRIAHDITIGRAITAAFAGLLVQAMVGAIFLR